jgi:hypothetical protein
MEPKAKKMKLNEDKVNLDPLERIHSDLHNLIFQHFKGKEVLKLSKVATDWHLILGKSRVAMSKIQLSLTAPSKKSDIGEALLTSERRYSRCVFLCYHKTTAIQSFNILKAIADSLEHLEVRQVTNDLLEMLDETVPDSKSIKFPKFKSLNLIGYTTAPMRFAQWILDRSNKEEFRKIHLPQYFPEMIKMALKMPKLKYFGISYSPKNPINLEHPVNESVTFAVINHSNPNLEKSLIGCLPNLEELEIEYIKSDNLKVVAENLPKLKKLHFKLAFMSSNILKTYEQLKLTNPLINQNIELIKKPQGFNLMHQD